MLKNTRSSKCDYLHIRLSKNRMGALRYLASVEEKTMTRIIEDLIDGYVLPRATEYKKQNEGSR